MNYLEAANDMDLCPMPNEVSDEDVQRDTVADQKASKARESARRAQQKFRNRRKEKWRLQGDQIEAQNRELKKEQERRTSLEQQLQQIKAENAQLNLRLNRSEEYCTVLQGSMETLRKSLDLLGGDTNNSHQGSNRPSTGHMTLSPSTSQSGFRNQIAPRPLSQLPNYLKRTQHRPMLSPISPMWERGVINSLNLSSNKSQTSPTHPPSSLSGQGE